MKKTRKAYRAPLNPEDRSRLSTAKRGIEVALSKGGKTVFDVGKLLSEGRGELKWGTFGTWVENELPFSRRMAQMYMRIAKMLPHDQPFLHRLQIPTLTALAQEKLSDEARASIVQAIGRGELRADQQVLERVADCLSPNRRDEMEAASVEREEQRRRRNEALLEVAVVMHELPADRFGVLLAQLRTAGLAELVEVMEGLAGSSGSSVDHVHDGDQGRHGMVHH